MRVVITREAREDLDAIYAYIAKESGRRAGDVVSRLETAILAIGDQPLAFPFLPSREATGVHRRVVRPHLVFYRVRQDHVEILRVIHGARDYERLLFPEDE